MSSTFQTRERRAGRRDAFRPWLTALGTAASAALALHVAMAPTTAEARSGSCVQTPAQYRTAFQNCQPIACVDDDLYGVIGFGTPAEQTSIYPPGFRWAWVSGSENLKRYADWRLQACRGGIPQADVTRNILLYVGFGEGDIISGQPYTLSVMDLSDERSLFVPTPASWVKAFQQVFSLDLPLASQKQLTLDLSSPAGPAPATDPVDPTQNFANLTGCSAASAAMCTDAPIEQCSPGYAAAAARLQNESPYNPGKTTASCVAEFKSYLAGRDPTAPEMRAMLRYCEDVNPCNSGQGYGFNPAFPNRTAGLLDHFTGPEFVLRNQSLSGLGAAKIALTTPP